MNRPIFEIAKDIRKDWTNANPYALPYLEAMDDLYSIEDKYIFDSAKSVIRYFLANATSWKGEVAREIKQELKNMVA
jgi:hypothetical protein|tara:strand:- start:1222 stop:1452 length:231 start_codon:yes stop_codon:yes gene_type:complete